MQSFPGARVLCYIKIWPEKVICSLNICVLLNYSIKCMVYVMSNKIRNVKNKWLSRIELRAYFSYPTL
jgi:hypothetical protein